MLRLAIIREHEADLKTAGQRDILIDTPLAAWLEEEIHASTLFGFRKRHSRKALKALRRIEDRIKQETINL